MLLKLSGAAAEKQTINEWNVKSNSEFQQGILRYLPLITAVDTPVKLQTHRMNLYPGEKQPIMHDTILQNGTVQ